MIKIIWAFRVRAAAEKEFVAAYGPHGDWARLFAKAPGYHGTQLLKDAPESQRYLTIDSWDRRAAFDGFKRARAEAAGGERGGAENIIAGAFDRAGRRAAAGQA